MRRAIISLADALRAAADLQPLDEATRQAVRSLLGLDPVAERLTAPATMGAWMPSSSHDVMASQRKAGAPVTNFALAQAPAGPADAAGQAPGAASVAPSSASTNTITRLERRSREPELPPWLAQVAGYDTTLDVGDAPEPQPLFDRVQRRGILASALATQVPEGELDVAGIVDTVAAGRPLARLPRQPVPTLRHGVQVLLDVSPGLDPFADDQRSLVRALDEVLADARLQVLRFSGCPSRGVLGDARTRPSVWQPPAAGVPVLVVSDFGIGGPLLDPDRSTVSEWVDFVSRVRGAGHMLAGLVPYEATRWPVRLARAMALLHWSERTTVGAVRRALRDARRRLRP